ncbi:bola-like protein [Microstroma glucosiphilum]|uniref:Bola-like protein n=1 Tax=Pseudomicrostroma glucosiphilum TaxID=1684307 RepID=A0A316UF05_9BASI|nr:bola-like protein [Pseudomicrostroma glucosiphilum]PWN23822.1 bola-like protein [Pseudomicrostroma glucosiphilum]
MISASHSMGSVLRSVSSSSTRRLFTTSAAPRRSFSLVFNAPSTFTSRSLAPSGSVSTMTNQSLRSTPRLFHSSASAHQEGEASASQQEMSSGEADIHALLSKRFNPSHLQVQDVSGGCGSFYAIVVASKEFQGLNTVKQHRMVNECLKDIIGGIHGLQLKTVASD